MILDDELHDHSIYTWTAYVRNLVTSRAGLQLHYRSIDLERHAILCISIWH
jgi:hypothetical protein